MIGTRLATLDPDTGERPKSRIGNAGNCRTLVQRLKYEDETRMYRYTRVQGLLDGNPPWPQKRLVDLGQGHRANFNLRESEGIVDSAKTPYYDLVFEVPLFAQIYLDVPGVAPDVRAQWENKINQQYYETLCQWDGFDQQIQLSQWQMIVNGVGPMFWPHSIGWRSQAIKCRKALVPQETYANVDELELLVILHSYRADELDAFTSNPGAATAQGWDVALTREAIIDAAYREMRQEYGIENYDLYQRSIRTGDIFYGIHRSTRIYVASMFVKEFGGKVSHYMITDSASGASQAQAERDDRDEEYGYIFKKKNKFDGFQNVICPFFFDTGPDGTWHSVKGLGPKIYDFCDVSNRTFCQMLDGSVIGSGITLEAQDGASLEETQIALIGGATVVAPGYKVAQTRIAESLNGAMTMRRELQNVLQSNTGSYRQRPAEEQKEPTLGQAQLNYQQQALLSKGATNRYYNNLDRWHRETLRRLLDPAAQRESIPGGKEAQQFILRCVLSGVPPEILNYRFVRKVSSVRSLGYGSPQLRDMATKELIGMVGLMDETGRNHALRARASALPGIGPDNVDSFFPPIEQKGVPNAHAALAVLENNALRMDHGQALVEPQQDHATHFDVHYKDASDHLKDQSRPMMERFIHAENSGRHMQRHLMALQGDPTRKDELAQKAKQLQALSKETDRLHQNISEALSAQPQPDQNQQPDPEHQAKLEKMRGDMQIKAQKARGDMALKVRKAQVTEHLADQKTAADIRRQNARASNLEPALSQ